VIDVSTSRPSALMTGSAVLAFERAELAGVERIDATSDDWHSRVKLSRTLTARKLRSPASRAVSLNSPNL
jgi:hypothetical protein